MQIGKLEQKKMGKTVLVYGESGAGKTTLIGTLPQDETLLIDVEGGTVVLHDSAIDCIKIRDDLSNLKDAFDGLVTHHQQVKGYKNIALDSATELEKFMLIRLAENSSNGMPTLHDYGVVSFKMRDYMRRMRDLRELGINVIVTALETPLDLEQSDETIRTRIYPMLARKLAPEICGLFDIVAHIEISSKTQHEGERFLRLDGNERIIAKNRYGKDKFCIADLPALFKLADGEEKPKSEVQPPATTNKPSKASKTNADDKTQPKEKETK